MSSVTGRNVPWWQYSAYPTMLGMIVVLLIAASVVLIQGAIKFSGEDSAYRAARVCESPVDIGSCRFQGRARVLSTWTDKQGNQVKVAFDQLGGLQLSATMDPAAQHSWQTWNAGDELDAELWQAKLTMLGGARTGYNPEGLVGIFIPAAYIVPVITILLLAVLIFWVVAYRRAAKSRGVLEATVETAHPVSTSQLPLTPNMTAYLQGEIKSNPRQLVAVVLVVAVLLPLLFTVVFYFQGRLLMPWTFIQWLLFLGIGGFFSWFILMTVGLEKRDLAAGVFTRASGVFHVAVFYSKAGTRTEVTIGGHTARGGLPAGLQGINSALGTVDYLPISGEMLEVRDESGQVLWSRRLQGG